MSEVSIRAAVQSDLVALTALYNHYILHTAITFDTEPWSIEQRREWLSHYASTGRHRLLVAESAAGSLLGYASSSPFRPKAAYDTTVETSVYVSPDAHGHGIGTALYTRLFEILSTEDVHRAIAGITLPNDKSLALHVKFGFVETGRMTEVGRKFDQYWDVAWLEKDLHLKPAKMVAFYDKQRNWYMATYVDLKDKVAEMKFSMFTHSLYTNLHEHNYFDFNSIAFLGWDGEKAEIISFLEDRLDFALFKLKRNDQSTRVIKLRMSLEKNKRDLIDQWISSREAM